jgi:hypothetical protein
MVNEDGSSESLFCKLVLVNVSKFPFVKCLVNRLAIGARWAINFDHRNVRK